MKRKVGELFNKPIVQGNENVLSSNEILVEQKGDTFSLKERVNGEIKEVSGGGNSTAPIEYISLSGNMFLADILTFGMTSLKVKIEGGTIPIEYIITSGAAAIAMTKELQQMGATYTLVALAFDPNLINLTKQNGEIIRKTAYEALTDKGEAYIKDYKEAPRITEEEFYTV